MSNYFRALYWLCLPLVAGCDSNNEMNADVSYEGDEDQVRIVKKELRKLFKENPVPYRIEVYCKKDEQGGYYVRGNVAEQVRVIVVSGDEKELIRLIRHEYQHAVDEYRGVETSAEREAHSKEAEKRE